MVLNFQFPFSHTPLETQRKWSTTEQEAYGFVMPLQNGIIITKE